MDLGNTGGNTGEHRGNTGEHQKLRAATRSLQAMATPSTRASLAEMCHNTTHRGQHASASGDYLLYRPPVAASAEVVPTPAESSPPGAVVAPAPVAQQELPAMVAQPAALLSPVDVDLVRRARITRLAPDPDDPQRGH